MGKGSLHARFSKIAMVSVWLNEETALESSAIEEIPGE
jgi:hypothetical protein